VPHAFKKKSTQGKKRQIVTCKSSEMRLGEAERISAEWRAQRADADDTMSSQTVFCEPGST
jgi:hypothetical protein